jgi:tRNA(adenine34) deaminase
VIVRDGVVLGEGWNQPIGRRDPTAHAEILALRAAALQAGDYRLGGATLYVTLEPCPMCAAACAHARLARLVFGAWDPRQGAAGSVFDLVNAAALNHRVDAFGGVLAEECGAILRQFFAGRR